MPRHGDIPHIKGSRDTDSGVHEQDTTVDRGLRGFDFRQDIPLVSISDTVTDSGSLWTEDCAVTVLALYKIEYSRPRSLYR